MMMEPGLYRMYHDNDSLEELYEARRELMELLIDYEEDPDKDISFMLPNKKTQYDYTNLYLIEICKLIKEKLYGSEE